MRRLSVFVALCVFAALPATAAITGYVMNSDGQPIPGARVETFAIETVEATRGRLLSATPEAKALASAVADAKGKFTLESPKDPVVLLQVTANGFAPSQYRVERDEDAGALILTPAEMKTGHVTANGKPVAGAKVVWGGNGEVIATTDAQGTYKVPDPAKWASNVVVLHPDYAAVEDFTAAMAGRGRARARGAATINEAADRSLSGGSSLHGTVVAEDGKTPVADATVSIDGWPVAKSAQDGTFGIAHAPAKWELIVAKNGALVGTRARAGAGDNVVVKLARAASVSGTIHDAKSQTPVAGAQVFLRAPMRMDTSLAFDAVTDAKGAFTLNGVVPGSYTIFANRPGYAIPNVSVSVAANERVTKPIIATQLARVTGTIVDEQRRPVAAARVASQQVSRGDGNFMMMMMMNGRGPSSAASAPDGTFFLRADPDTDLQIEAMKKGYPAARSSKLRLTPGERKSGVVLTIPSGVAVTGRVIDKNGKPIPGVTVVAAESTGGPGGNFVRRMVMMAPRGRDDEQIKTAADGTFTTRVKEGTYDFAFHTDGYATKAVRAVQIGANPKPIEVTLEPGVEISGRVTRAGMGIDGVRINVLGEGNPGSPEFTAADGTFRIADLSPGPYMLNATKEDEFIQQIRPVNAPSTDVNIDLPQGGRVSGRVVEKGSGKPVTAFEAGVSTPRGGGGMIFMTPPAMRHFTNDDGTFTLENVPPGQTQVVVNAPGYTTARLPNVNVEDGKTISDLQVELDHGVRAVGHVTGPDGSALAGVSVSIEGGGRMMNVGPRMNQTVTDGNGDFTMDALESGEKTFVFNRGGYLSTQKTVTLSGTETRVDAQLSTGQRVSGIVVNEAQVPVPDATVYANSATVSAFGNTSTRTDSDGSFSFDGLTPGYYNFTARKAGLANGDQKNVDISSGAPVRITMKSGGVIYGQVTGLTADELQRANVVAQSSSGGTSGPVDATGAFHIEGVPIGTVRVSANLGGGPFGNSKSSPVQSVQVDAGSQVQVNIAFKSDTVITGRVTRNGQPVQGAMVTFSPKDAMAQTRASATTDSSGHYTVSGLDDAMYNVGVVDIQRSAPYATTYQVHGSGSFDVDMKASALHGRVLDTDGAAVADAIVEVRTSGGDSQGFRMSRAVQTDAGGNFLVDNVPAGSYSVSATKEGYGTRVVDTAVDDSGGNVDITLAKNQGVALRVVDARDGRLINAFVNVTNARGQTVPTGPAFNLGGPDVIKLPLDPGTYTAEISAQGYATQKVTITSPSSPTIGMTPGGTIAVQSKGSSLRRARLLAADGSEYRHIFTLDPSPGVTTINNIAPGVYTLQILGEGNEVTATARVTVMEGQMAAVSI